MSLPSASSLLSRVSESLSFDDPVGLLTSLARGSSFQPATADRAARAHPAIAALTPEYVLGCPTLAFSGWVALVCLLCAPPISRRCVRLRAGARTLAIICTRGQLDTRARICQRCVGAEGRRALLARDAGSLKT